MIIRRRGRASLIGLISGCGFSSQTTDWTWRQGCYQCTSIPRTSLAFDHSDIKKNKHQRGNRRPTISTFQAWQGHNIAHSRGPKGGRRRRLGYVCTSWNVTYRTLFSLWRRATPPTNGVSDVTLCFHGPSSRASTLTMPNAKKGRSGSGAVWQRRRCRKVQNGPTKHTANHLTWCCTLRTLVV